MVLDDKKIADLLDGLMLKAKDTRAAIPYSKEDAFAQCILMLGPNFEPETLPALWRNEREKYDVMRNVSALAKMTCTRLVVLITDTRWTNATPELCEFLGVPPVEEIGAEAWGKRYSRAITEKYDGLLKNLPRQYWKEAICIIMKGPELKGKIPMKMAQYERGPNDSIHWLREGGMDGERAFHFNLLPDWWV
jgi:hypothetical protein